MSERLYGIDAVKAYVDDETKIDERHLADTEPDDALYAMLQGRMVLWRTLRKELEWIETSGYTQTDGAQ